MHHDRRKVADHEDAETNHQIHDELHAGGQGRTDRQHDGDLTKHAEQTDVMGQRLAHPVSEAAGKRRAFGSRHDRVELRRNPLGHFHRHRVDGIIHRVKTRLEVERPGEDPTQDHRHGPAGQENPEVLPDKELTTAHRLADHGDRRPAFDFFVDGDAGCQQAEQSREQHHRVKPDLLHQFVVITQREVGNESRDEDQDRRQGGNQPKHRLTQRLAKSRDRHRPALRPEQQQQSRRENHEVQDCLSVENRAEVPAITLEFGDFAHLTHVPAKHHGAGQRAEGKVGENRRVGDPFLEWPAVERGQPGNGEENLKDHEDQRGKNHIQERRGHVGRIVAGFGIFLLLRYEPRRGSCPPDWPL